MTSSAASAPKASGRLYWRFAPIMLARSEARMSTASRPSRKTIVAELKMTAAGAVPDASAAWALLSAASSDWRETRTCSTPARLASRSCSPRVSPSPSQKRRSTRCASPGREGQKSFLGSGLEDGVRFDTGRFRLLILPGRDGRHHLIEQRLDDVEVGVPAFVASMTPGRWLAARCAAAFASAAIVPGSATASCDAVAPMALSSRSERSGDAGGAGRVALLERQTQFGEGIARAVEEGAGLLDLQIESDLPVVDAPTVLDRDEREIAQELSGAARQLRFGEGRGAETLHDLGRIRRGAGERGGITRFGAGQDGGEGLVGLDPRRATLLRGERRGQDGPVAGDLTDRFRLRRGEFAGTRCRQSC